MNTERIEYPDRARLVEGIKNLSEDETVANITVVYPGTALRVTRVEGYDGDENGPEPVESAQETSAETEPDSESGDESPAGESAQEDSEEIDLETASRDQLREIVADYALDIEIPDHGPLAPIRAKVAEAFNE